MLAAVEKGDLRKLAELIRQRPGFKVNEELGGGRGTLLNSACFENNRSPMIPLLLAHPDIDVNLKNSGGYTPFSRACYSGNTSCVREMVKDSRVKVNEPINYGVPPLRLAASLGHLDVIKWWIASGREMDLGKPGDNNADVIWVAKEQRRTEVATLLERFKSDAAQTRDAIRVEIGWYDEAAAEMFALVVFVSDGLLQIKDTTPSSAVRFFNIARRLPLELQMIVCHLVVGSAKEIIPGNESEVAFKSLASRLVWSSIFTN